MGEGSTQETKRPPRKRWSGMVIALIFAGIGIVASGTVKNAGDWAWNHVTGEDRAKLRALDVRVVGETATSANFNADALQRIVTNSEFPRIQLLLRNNGGKTGTFSRIDIKLKRVWTLRDPHGPVKPPKGVKPPETPAFGAYKGEDVRFDARGFVVPDSVPQAFDMPSKSSKPVQLTFRNIEEPSTKEYIARLDLVVRYDDDHRLSIRDVFFSSAAIGSFYPAYERELIINRGERYDEEVAMANAKVIGEIRRLTGQKSPRVKFLEQEFRLKGLD